MAHALQDVPLSSGAKLTIERRGQIVLLGINRPDVQNRIDPETFEQLAEAYYRYDSDPSLRAAVLFGHGENFSRGIDVEGFASLAGTGKPWIASTETIDPLAKRAPRLSKPLIAVTHGDTWNMGNKRGDLGVRHYPIWTLSGTKSWRESRTDRDHSRFGMQTSIVVPAPGGLLTWILPPSPSIRSLSPVRPDPRLASAPPTPSSRIESTRMSPST